MDADHSSHSLCIGIERSVPKKAPDEFGCPVISHVQPHQAIIRVNPIGAIEVSIQAEKGWLRQVMQQRDQIFVVVPRMAVSTPTTRKRIRHLRSKSRWSAGKFSSSTNIESLEWLVLNNKIGDRNRFGDRLLWDIAIPLPLDLPPCEAAIKLLQDNPYHDPRSFE